MDKTQKTEKLRKISETLSCGVHENGFVKNVDTVFFRVGGNDECLWENVYLTSIECGLEFELLDLDDHYFAGSLNHAKKLIKHYGGSIWRTKFHNMPENPRDLWVWHLDVRTKRKAAKEKKPAPMKYEDVVNVLFAGD